ncbi:MAG: inositol monophosphatase [Caldilineaceae bacterium]|nr:inositol monophosphatase [Caldilineaceae bacterium]
MEYNDTAARIAAALSPDELNAYREFALATAREAGDLAAASFGHATAERKADGSLVTQVDKACDRLIARRIHAAYPSHAVLSEEQDTSYDPANTFTWVVDPIDGTTNYARGLPIWGVSIALMFEGMPVVGAVVFPLLHEEFSAAHKLGATAGTATIHASTVEIPDDESFVMTCTRTPKQHHLKTPLKARILGAAAYHLAKVADGTGLASVEATPKIWDLAAVDVIVREAGAILELQDGGAAVFPIPPERLDYGHHDMPIVAAANRPIMNHMRSALQ